VWSFGAGTSLVDGEKERNSSHLSRANIWLTHASLAPRRAFITGDARGSLVKTMGERIKYFLTKSFLRPAAL
jgi:hypothetical protein